MHTSFFCLHGQCFGFPFKVSFSFRGSSIAKIIGHNVKASNRFDPMVNMWVYEEMINGKKLTEIINTDHENVKYLPGHKLPRNVVSLDKDYQQVSEFTVILQNNRVTN